jgi:hypothetical protein
MWISSIQVVICLLAIPMCKFFKFSRWKMLTRTDVFGKRNRSFFHRHDILKLTHLT